MLILAGITINLVLADGGIFEKAQYAKNEWEDATAEEQGVLGNIDNSIDSIISSRNPTTTNPPNGTEYNFGGGNMNGFTANEGEIINHSLGLTYGTFSEEVYWNETNYNIAKCEKEVNVDLNSKFEISSSIYFYNPAENGYAGGIAINFLKDDNVVSEIRIVDNWLPSKLVGLYVDFNNQVIANKLSTDTSSTYPFFINNASGRFAIIGDGQKVYAYFGDMLLGSIDSAESLSFDKIIIYFLKAPSYAVPNIYLESLYVGEPYYYQSFIENN